MPDWSILYQHLETEGVHISPGTMPTPVSGGDISAAWRLPSTNGDLFIKTGPGSSENMFAAEADALAELAQPGGLRVPRLIATGQCGSLAFLALEWIRLEAADAKVEHLMGQQLAELHRNTRDRCGWHRDNTIGLTPQINTWDENWIDFYREHRLAFQLRLAADNGFGGDLKERGSRLLKRLPVYFETTAPPVSLLHGDLWGGNWGSSEGQPVIFDPAVYYGDRETDIAMTRLFGGFGTAFYDAYEAAWPLADGHEDRQHLYQLYHLLNHLNLFGSGYLGRAIGLMDKLL
jgi:protein-ribulosamine 3-kinase